jgi:ankyrin repeat protein
MDMAARHGHAQVVKLLLGWRDGSMVLMGQGEFTPLLLAAQEGHVDVLKVLLAWKDGPMLAKCCLQDGRNALALAEQHGHVEAARFLRAFDGGSLFGNACPTPEDEMQPGS